MIKEPSTQCFLYFVLMVEVLPSTVSSIVVWTTKPRNPIVRGNIVPNIFINGEGTQFNVPASPIVDGSKDDV